MAVCDNKIGVRRRQEQYCTVRYSRTTAHCAHRSAQPADEAAKAAKAAKAKHSECYHIVTEFVLFVVFGNGMAWQGRAWHGILNV